MVSPAAGFSHDLNSIIHYATRGDHLLFDTGQVTIHGTVINSHPYWSQFRTVGYTPTMKNNVHAGIHKRPTRCVQFQ